MNKSDIVIFGSNGMLGSYVSTYFTQKNYNVINITRQHLDIITSENLLYDLEQLFINRNIHHNSVIINCIGLIPQTQITDSFHYFLINSVFPYHLSQLSFKYNSKLIHPTTDCVFSGKQGYYNEYNLKDEKNIYGLSKILGENIPHTTIIRTSIIGEQTHHNYSLLQWLISNKNNTVNGYTNHLWNGITCLQFAKIIEYIIQYNMFWTGIRHIFSNETISKYQLLQIINDVYKLNITIHPTQTKDNIDKSLTTIHTQNLQHLIPSIQQQIEELYYYDLKK